MRARRAPSAGAERKVRAEFLTGFPGGTVWHFEGEQGAERMVRVEQYTQFRVLRNLSDKKYTDRFLGGGS